MYDIISNPAYDTAKRFNSFAHNFVEQGRNILLFTLAAILRNERETADGMRQQGSFYGTVMDPTLALFIP